MGPWIVYQQFCVNITWICWIFDSMYPVGCVNFSILEHFYSFESVIQGQLQLTIWIWAQQWQSDQHVAYRPTLYKQFNTLRVWVEKRKETKPYWEHHTVLTPIIVWWFLNILLQVFRPYWWLSTLILIPGTLLWCLETSTAVEVSKAAFVVDPVSSMALLLSLPLS